ncbi:ethanolamine ammonia-lyase subunit EutC [Massilia sp. W12]|uniref:ethanolamine ammonia-lyase subunit EutC n=1 Tax=Massilia sp. W12 TaxID=3126507 RepID=UPI0030D11211
MDKLPAQEQTEHQQNTVQDNPWQGLRRFTAARIALGRAGTSLPTRAHLAFQAAHACARDAVHLPLAAEELARDVQAVLRTAGAPDVPCLQLHSRARTRQEYLQRPDYGRQLAPASRSQLQALPPAGADLALVLADGLSALALRQQAAPFLQALLPLLGTDWRLAPLSIVQQGRVAIGDEIGHLLQARCVLVLIGERPGLSSPDSMGLYLSWQPRPGMHDAMRNCISNIRPGGLDFATAAQKAHYLLQEARRIGLSGVELKDETGAAAPELDIKGNFLLGS